MRFSILVTYLTFLKINYSNCDLFKNAANNKVYQQLESLSKQTTFINIIQKYKGILYKVITMYCKDEDDKKDLEQEILIQIWKSLDTYDDAYAMTTWLYRISMNVAISHYRKTFKHKGKLVSLDAGLLDFTPASEASERSYEQDVLQKLLNELNEFDKALMFLYLEDKDYEVIAQILGITKTNVATKINRIKQKWKQELNT
ncbi:RNA polymerase sigma-70 factor, ECF subfamily [Leeuwenhoekiella marinoflava DSM 3653]|uniref:RNA polymerase sigma-70 factor (ECF subfamily) n=2 Tax=Leeuwenhoekiella marinoflava TaxID=988 RepID=A0A4Q0PC57_9FLAO|nr:RNA polymerase sigma-70 factor (ECF subfamily) [Leeuwenhoekiella marinoflava]SHF94198.1 RNA polymerase sigma-70 factor, ECF subfamily [Leeuwenhoekiella marinoflava DSM 3653]